MWFMNHTICNCEHCVLNHLADISRRLNQNRNNARVNFGAPHISVLCDESTDTLTFLDSPTWAWDRIIELESSEQTCALDLAGHSESQRPEFNFFHGVLVQGELTARECRCLQVTHGIQTTSECRVNSNASSAKNYAIQETFPRERTACAASTNICSFHRRLLSLRSRKKSEFTFTICDCAAWKWFAFYR